MALKGVIDIAKLGAYLSDRWQRDVSCTGISQIFGGASRETYRVELSDDGTTTQVILRMPQENGLIDTPQETEHQAYKAFLNSDVPVPRLLAVEDSAAVLGGPFLIMELLPGESGNPFQRDFYKEKATAVGEQFWDILGHIAAVDPAAIGLEEYFGAIAPEACCERELDYWVGVLRSKSSVVEPIVEAAIRRLRRDRPPAAEAVRVVHGDFRMGNFLVEGERITGILDWELAHLGDPLEDLGWAMSRLWNRFESDRPGAMIATADAIAVWERSSGLHVDLAALQWWRLFNCVKGMAIWNSAGHSFATRANTFPGYLNGAWLAYDIHMNEILELMGRG